MATKGTKKARLNIRVPEPLLQWAKDFAVSKNTCVTQMIIDYFTELKETRDGK